MPPLSRAFVKSGFMALLLGLLAEALLARPVGLWPGLPAAAIRLSALHLLTVGWLLQVITGVAFWMFPRHRDHPPRGSATPGWAAWGLLNLGLLARVGGESWRLGAGGPLWPLQLSALLQFAAASCIVWLLWPRIREMAG